MNGPDRFLGVLAVLAETFEKKLTVTLAEAYKVALAELTVEQFQRAATLCMRSCRHFPKPAELLEAAGVSVSDRAERQFELISPAMARFGAYRSVEFSDPRTNATIRSLGGWQRVCGLDVNQYETWFRKEFVAVYRSLDRTGTPPALCGPLAGIIESTPRRQSQEQRIGAVLPRQLRIATDKTEPTCPPS